MFIGLGCLVVFFIMAALMYGRRISALLALPLMAVSLALLGGIPASDILKDVVNAGTVKLHSAYATTMIGAILAELVNKHGIAKAIVRFVAEFSGDNPYLLGLALTLVTALLFSSLGGLGAVIMVGTVVLPVMLSIGIPTLASGSLFLFGISLGGMFNLANWQLYVDVLKIGQAEIAAFVLPFAASIAVVIMAFLAIELKRLSNLKFLALGVALLVAAVLALGGFGSSSPETGTAASAPLAWSLVFVSVLLAAAAIYAGLRHNRKDEGLSVLSFLTPLLPLFLVLVGKWDIISAFFAGISYGALVTWKRDSINLLTRSIIEGAQSVIPAVILMMGIGMLLCAVMHPAVADAIAPLLTLIVPKEPLSYILGFTLLAPLALYRGPLSLWGMGSGLVALMQKSGALAGPAIMTMLMSVGQLQGVCDPTNTSNVWIATYLGTDTQALLRKTILFAWISVFVGLLMAVSFGYVR